MKATEERVDMWTSHSRMNWRKKALLALITTMVAFVVLVVAVAHVVLLPQTKRLEIAATERDLHRFSARISTDLAELRAQLLGYSAWDDTYAFALASTSDFIEKNIGIDALKSGRLSWMGLWNRQGEFLGGVIETKPGEAEEIPQAMVEALTAFLAQTGLPDEAGKFGLRWFGGTLTEVVVLPIVRGDFKGEARGVLVGGRRLAGESLEALIGSEFSSVQFRGSDTTPDLGLEVETPSEGIEVAFIDGERIAGRLKLAPTPGFPGLRIETFSTRPLMRAQERTIRLLTVAVLSGSVAMSAILWLIGERVFVRRLERVRRLVENLGSEKVAMELRGFPGKDEVSQLAQLTGTMALHLQEARKAAEAAAQAKSRFLSTMSHEIRTPLNAVLGYSSLLRSTSLDPKQAEWLQALVTGGEALVGVIGNILDYEKAENGRLELNLKPTKLRSLILDTVTAMAPYAASKELKLESGMETRVPEIVIVDAARLRQVLVNLIANAIKFTHAGSVEVTIAAKSTSAENRLRLEFRVHDTGPGISRELIPRLFTPFTQADDSNTRAHGGVGMGLAICSRLLRAFGGEIHLETTSELGTAFAFSFEANLAEANVAEKVPVTADPTPVHIARHVLVAEDNAVNRALLRTMLRRLGHECEFAVNGIEAFKKMQNLEVDVVLMDVQMPERDGCEATALYRSWERTSERLAPLPIIALTANTLPEDRERCLAVGMVGYLNKPILLTDLRAAIAKYTHDPTIESPSPL